MTTADTTLASDGSQTSVTFTCEVGSALVGADTATCRHDGTWSNTEPTCGEFAIKANFILQMLYNNKHKIMQTKA